MLIYSRKFNNTKLPYIISIIYKDQNLNITFNFVGREEFDLFPVVL
jgi:hypothetical protein